MDRYDQNKSEEISLISGSQVKLKKTKQSNCNKLLQCLTIKKLYTLYTYTHTHTYKKHFQKQSVENPGHKDLSSSYTVYGFNLPACSPCLCICQGYCRNAQQSLALHVHLCTATQKTPKSDVY